MNRWRRALALALCISGSLGSAAVARAQGIAVAVPALLRRADSTSPAPVITVTAAPVPAEFLPSTVTLELALDQQFRAPFYVRSTNQLQAQFLVDSLLPAKTMVYYRARLFDRFGTVRAETITGHPIAAWLGLAVSGRTTNVLFTTRPRFDWSSPPITLPPGPWQYEITIFNVGQNQITTRRTVNDTTYTPESPLDACTSYRWSVTARALNSARADQVTVNAPGTFVIQSRECPQATIFYQNFPNPFGARSASGSTCFWFDLAHRSTVHLSVYDIRLREVKRMVPGALAALLDSGAYGRQTPTEPTGCDPRLSWDGRDDQGHPVAPGVYIAVFEADGVRSTKKILYKGP